MVKFHENICAVIISERNHFSFGAHLELDFFGGFFPYLSIFFVSFEIYVLEMYFWFVANSILNSFTSSSDI